MGIKIKHTDPTLNSFATDDLVVNVQSGSLFFKSNTKLYKLQGDDQSTTDITDSLKITGLISSIGYRYVVELDGNSSSGPRINMGTSPTNTTVSNDSDLFMTFGAFGSINNIDTKDRDFHLYGTNTTTGFYFDESVGNFGIGTTTPKQKLHVDGNIILGDNAGGGEFIHGQDNLALSADGAIAIVADANDTSGTGASDLFLGYGSSKDLNTSPSETFADTFPNDTPRVTLIKLDSSANRIAMGQNVGGMTPDTRLHISASDVNILKLERSDANNVNIAYKNITGTMYAGIDTVSSALIWGVGSNKDMSTGAVLTVTGSHVGIGTTSPDCSLEVESLTDDLIARFNSSTSEDKVKGIRINAADAGGTQIYMDLVVDPVGDKVGIGIGTAGGNLPIGDANLNNAELVISSSGNVGIGTASPLAQLYVQIPADASSTGAATTFTEVAAFKNPTTGGTSNDGISSGIKLKLGTTSEHHKWAGISCASIADYANTTRLEFWPNDTTGGVRAILTSGGNWDIDGSVNAGSDIRLKENINDIENPLETIKKLRGVTFDWIDKGKDPDLQIGFIAQEVEKILPNLIKNNQEYKHLNYTGVIPILVEALKDQQKQIDELKKQING